VTKTGVLPKRPPERLYGGFGTGARCAICGGRTAREEMELELVFNDEDGREKTYYAHQRCFSSRYVGRPRGEPDSVP